MDQKNSNVHLIISAIVILIVIVGGVYAFTKENTPSSENNLMHEEDTSMTGKDTVMEKEEGAMEKGSYEAYTPQKLARAESGDVVLFFHASWCPSCRGLNADIEKNMMAIPADLSILKVDYDTETELKKKYGVTNQHTLVQVAVDGTLIKKWSGSPTLDSLISEIN